MLFINGVVEELLERGLMRGSFLGYINIPIHNKTDTGNLAKASQPYSFASKLSVQS